MSVDITIQETVNEVDITVNQNVITVNVIRTTGSGGVESVTGDLVNNTDPLNPVVETPSLTQVLTAGDILPYTISIPNNTFVTFDLGRELTENYFTTDDVGTGGVFLDKDVVFPDNATIRFQAGYVEDNVTPTNVTLLPYRFTTDAYVFYQGARVTDITLRPEDVCMLKLDGENSTDSIQIWFLTVVSKSSGGSGTVTSVTGDLVDNTDPLNPIINTPSFAETLAVDNKTNEIPIVSNNGKARVDVNDNYLDIGYENNYLLLDPANGLQLFSDTNVFTIAPYMDASIDNAISYTCPSFTLNGEEVATQPYADAKVANDLTASTTVAPSKTAVLTEYDMITGLTFSGAFALDKKGGRSYLPYTQTGSLTLSIGGSPIIGSFAVLRFTADGSAITGYAGWKLLSSDAITATNGVVHRVIVYQYEDEIWYSVKLN